MRWEGERESDNVEDDRGGGGGRGPMMIGGGLGSIVLVVLFLVLGGDPAALLQNPNLIPQQGPAPGPREVDPAEEGLTRFVKVVLGSTEDVWRVVLPQQERVRYHDPKLVLFSGQVQSACGLASAAVGPFYCPGDERVYLDLQFFQEMKTRFHATGEFAQAYVIAHEVGHHVQNILGITEKVDSARQRVSREEYNRLSVRLELQADFFAGVWAHHANEMRHIIEAGDIEAAMRCASAIGDDTLQRQARGHVVPDSFTHGTSEQRVRWFKRGYTTGDIRQGDTFSAKEL